MTAMRQWGNLAALAAVYTLVTGLAACAPPPGAAPTGPPPAANAPPLLPGEQLRGNTRAFRLDMSAELAMPQGDLSDRQDSGTAVRVSWFGGNFTQYFAMGIGFRMIQTSPNDPNESLLFFDLIGYWARVTVPVLPQLKAFGEFEPSLVGMHVPCTSTTISCNEDGNEFVPRLGLSGRGGGIYEVIPYRLDLEGYLMLEKTFPDEGGWFGIGVGMTVHYGPTHRTMGQRRAWLRQQQAK
jgi:hypothetical protein